MLGGFHSMQLNRHIGMLAMAFKQSSLSFTPSRPHINLGLSQHGSYAKRAVPNGVHTQHQTLTRQVLAVVVCCKLVSS